MNSFGNNTQRIWVCDECHKTFCPVAKCVIIWPTGMSNKRVSHIPGGPTRHREAEYRRTGRSGEALWNEAGVIEFSLATLVRTKAY